MQDFASFSFDIPNEIETEVDSTLQPKINLVKKLLVQPQIPSEQEHTIKVIKTSIEESILSLLVQIDYEIWDESSGRIDSLINQIIRNILHTELVNKNEILLKIPTTFDTRDFKNFLKQINIDLSELGTHISTNFTQHYFYHSENQLTFVNYLGHKIKFVQKDIYELQLVDIYDDYNKLISESFVGSSAWPWNDLSLTVQHQSDLEQYKQAKQAQIILLPCQSMDDFSDLCTLVKDNLFSETYIVLWVGEQFNLEQQDLMMKVLNSHVAKLDGISIFQKNLKTLYGKNLCDWLNTHNRPVINHSVEKLKFILLQLKEKLRKKIEQLQSEIQLYTKVCLHEDEFSTYEKNLAQETLKELRSDFQTSKILIEQFIENVDAISHLFKNILPEDYFENEAQKQEFDYQRAQMLLENGFYSEALQYLKDLNQQGMDVIQDIIIILANHFDELKNVSLEERFEWIQAASKYSPNNSYFHNLLGICYEQGLGCVQDFVLAFQEYQLASKSDSEYAMNKLGEFYLRGQGIAANEEKAFECFKEASEKNSDAKFNLGCCYLYGWGIAENERQGFNYLKEAAEQNNVNAQNLLADCYLYGWGIAQNDEQAFLWYMKAAEQGFVPAQYSVGWCYLYGHGTSINDGIAVEWLLKAAEFNNSDSQNSLGDCFLNGWGVTQNDHQAFNYYLKAAEQNHTAAQYSVGWCYLNGRGTEKNHKEAFDYFLKAATQGHAKAQDSLGDCYFYGWGVEQNNDYAFRWFQKSADQNYSEAQGNLAFCYQNGIGITEDLFLACQWYEKAAIQGHPSSQNQLANFYLNGWGTQENKELAFEWYEKSANLGFLDAENNLGRCYSYGWGVQKNQTKAFEWYERAANKGNSGAQYNAGTCLLNAVGVREDKVKAYQYFVKAAEQGNSNAQNMLGLCYIHALGTPKDEYQAAHWFELARQQEHIDAYFNLGCAYLHGIGVEGNTNKAFRYFVKASKNGHIEAQYNLAGCYIEGWGTSKDLNLAKKWLREAADQGHKEALQYLQSL